VEALYVLQEKWNPPRKEAASERVAHWGAHVVGVVAGLAWVGRNLDGRTTVTSSRAQSHGRSSIPPLARMAEEDW
jgi:hypothetical protein